MREHTSFLFFLGGEAGFDVCSVPFPFAKASVPLSLILRFVKLFVWSVSTADLVTKEGAGKPFILLLTFRRFDTVIHGLDVSSSLILIRGKRTASSLKAVQSK